LTLAESAPILLNMNTANDNASPKQSTFRFRGMMQPYDMSRAEWAQALLRILKTERRYSAAHGRQYRLAAWVLGQSVLPTGM
jgi:hypothetical protein